MVAEKKTKVPIEMELIELNVRRWKRNQIIPFASINSIFAKYEYKYRRRKKPFNHTYHHTI